MSSPVVRLLSLIATRIKGRPFDIDDRVGIGYLIGIGRTRVLMKVRGSLRFPLRADKPFVGRNVRIKRRGSLTMGAGVSLGDGVVIDALSQRGVVIGERTSLARGCRIECTGTVRTLGVGLRIGSHGALGPETFFGCAGGIEIGDHTVISQNSSFHSENHVIDRLDIPILDQGVTHQGIVVGRDCWIGSKVIVLDGVRLGDGCVVAAGAVLTAGVYDSYGIYGGVPAKLIGKRTEE